MRRGRLDGDGHDTSKYWTVFSDVALALLLIFLLFILAQFLHYEKIAILEAIEERQEEVSDLISSALAPHQRQSVQIVRQDDHHQRITFQSELLFESCGISVRPSGRRLTAQVGEVLAQKEDYFASIQIEGHTDVRPPGDNCPVRDNWELSSQRATVVLRVLTDSTTITPDVLSSVGRGAYHPVEGAEGHTPEDYRRNRRIELVLRYTEEGVMENGGA